MVIDRRVRQVFPNPTQESPERGVLSAYLNEANIVLLGDPGSGKTHTFAEAAKHSSGTALTARQYLILPSQELHSPLFIDALDERRAGRGDNDIIDQIISKLFANPLERVRISCRDRDWLGDTDLSAFRTYFDRNGGAFVLQLLELSRDEQRSILASNNIKTPDAFLDEAIERGLSEFLNNPQNLLMLVEVVQKNGGWPTTFKELFEKYTKLLLSEANKVRSAVGLGAFSPGEIEDAAGIICVLRLLSDVEGISLENNTAKPEYPSYRTVRLADHEKVQASLNRRLFKATAEPATVSYTHRTSAEFIAAKSLAELVRGGYPVGRLQALIGIDGHPAAELRGLNAWLAVLLPEHAVRFIIGDPYGVLTYGDVASLTPSARLTLLKALSSATESDPWMRVTDLPEARIAPLFTNDTVAAIREIIRNPDAPFPLKILSLDSITAARGGAKVSSDLEAILLDDSRSFAERQASIEALQKSDPTGTIIVRNAYDALTKRSANNIRLKSHIANLLYGKTITPLNIATLMASAYECEDELHFGIFWDLPNKVEPSEAKTVLNAFVPLIKRLPSGRSSRRIANNINDTYDKILTLALEDPTITPDDLSLWLRARETLSSDNRRTDSGLRPALLKRTPLLLGVARKMLTDAMSQGRPFILNHMQSTTLSLLSIDDVTREFFDELDCAKEHPNDDAYLLGECLHVVMRQPSDAVVRFEHLWAISQSRPDLQAVFDSTCKPVTLPDRKYRVARKKEEELAAQSLAKSVEELRAIQDDVRSGKHKGFTTWLSRIYFAKFSDIDASLSPAERLASKVGEDLVPVALDALKASLQMPGFPSVANILDLHKEGKWWDWWHAIVAGVDLLWEETHSLEFLDDSALAAAVAIDVLHPTFEKNGNTSSITRRDWRREAERSRPSPAMATYRALTEFSLGNSSPAPWALSELLSDNLAPHNSNVALELLEKYPNAENFSWRTLVDAAKSNAQPSDVLDLARRLLGSSSLSPEAYDRWLVTAYLVAPSEFESAIVSRGIGDANFTWLLRDLSGSGFRNGVSSELSLEQLDCIAKIAAKHFPDAQHPSGGWSGDTNTWDAAEFIKGLIARISANTTRRATQTLEAMLNAPDFFSYQNYIKHSIANQLVRRREVEYQQPDWDALNLALSNGAPANAADLAALTIDHLSDLATLIATSNSDLYRHFWNEDSYGRTKSPKPEESCRDVLLEQLKARLLPLGIMVEPEAHMFGGKRADLSTALPNRKAFVELKRDYNAELWIAVNNQLDRYYTRDPDASGYGIYGVFWFGEKRSGRIPTRPGGLPEPTSAKDLEDTLTEMLTVAQRERIKVIVIDVSGEIPLPATA
jgi:hypothetical protein